MTAVGALRRRRLGAETHPAPIFVRSKRCCRPWCCRTSFRPSWCDFPPPRSRRHPSQDATKLSPPPRLVLSASVPTRPFAPPAPQVMITERRRSLLHLLTKLSAVIGGVFAVTGMVDKAVHAVTQIMFVDSKSRRR